MTRAKARPEDCRIMFDADVAAFLGIDKRTLQRRILRPVPGEIDPNDARPVTIGSRRLWRREDVERLVGLAPDAAANGKAKGGAK